MCVSGTTISGAPLWQLESIPTQKYVTKIGNHWVLHEAMVVTVKETSVPTFLVMHRAMQHLDVLPCK